MTDKRPRILWSIVAVLTLILIAIIVWALLRPDPAAPSVNPPQPKANYKTPVLAATPFATGLHAPTTITANGVQNDKRLFVAERGGTVRIVNPDGTVSAPILDISAKVLNNGEMGLLGLAFHPRYANNHFIYVYYINTGKKTVVARYTLDPATNTANTASEKVLLTAAQPYDNHKGGQLAFGPDGFLYIGLGDGGSGGDPENRAQDLHTVLGKILRIDVDSGDPYSTPAGNPFSRSTDNTVKPEIWAFGLRNPWRFSFDSKTGELYIADVGQNIYEEVDVQAAGSPGGENYGWRCREGLHDFNMAGCKDANQYVAPVFEYAHDAGLCSITGGYVYRGSAEPALDGLYIYGDYCTGEIMYASKQQGTWQQTIALKTNTHISSFGQDNAGELYIGDVDGGTIMHITDTAN